MFCQKCGSQISDEARFCDKCGTQVAAKFQDQTQRSRGSSASEDRVAAYPVNTTQQVNPHEWRKGIAQALFALVTLTIQFIAMFIAFFGNIMTVWIGNKWFDGPISDMIFEYRIARYISSEVGVKSIAFMLLCCIVCSLVAFIDIWKTGKLKIGFTYAGVGFLLIAFLISKLDDDIIPKGGFFLILFLFAFALFSASMQVKIGDTKELFDATSSSLFRAMPKNLSAKIIYENDVPDTEDLHALIEKTSLKEHLSKTHPSNQLYITVRQVIDQKFSEMLSPQCSANHRCFVFADNKNKIHITLSFDETRELECDIKINM